jgi:hypothetical protein
LLVGNQLLVSTKTTIHGSKYKCKHKFQNGHMIAKSTKGGVEPLSPLYESGAFPMLPAPPKTHFMLLVER